MKNQLLFHRVSLLIFMILYIMVPLGADSLIIWICLLNFYVVLFYALKKPLKIGSLKSYLTIDLLFLLFCFLVYFYFYQTYVLGLSKLSPDRFGKIYEEYVNPSIILSLIAVHCFCLGLKKKPKIIQSAHNDNVFKSKIYNKLAYFIAIIIGALITIFLKTGLGQIFAESYAGTSTGDLGADGVLFMLNFFIMFGGALVIFYYSQFKKLSLSIILILFLCAIWALFLLLLGDRNTFFLVAIVLGGGYFTFIKSINKKKLVYFAVFALVLYNVIEVSRQVDERSFSAIAQAAENYFADDSSSAIEDSSFMITTVGYRSSLAITPGQLDFTYGRFFFIGLLGLIPFSRGLVLDSEGFATSSQMITHQIFGPNASYGLGTNIISDIYFDSSIIGVLIVMYLLGRMASRLTTRIQFDSRDLRSVVMYILALALFAELPRYGLSFLIRNLVWSYVILRLFEFFVKRQRKTGRIL